MLSSTARAVVLFGALMASPAGATEAMSSLVDMLHCNQPPEPTAGLRQLFRDGVLQEDRRLGADSTYCWSLAKPVVIEGVAFDRICGSNDDPQAISENPEIYWRGPGTSAGTGISFVTAASEATVAVALQDFRGNHTDIGESYFYDDGTEVSCNTISFPADAFRPGFNADLTPEKATAQY